MVLIVYFFSLLIYAIYAYWPLRACGYSYGRIIFFLFVSLVLLHTHFDQALLIEMRKFVAAFLVLVLIFTL